jgi:uncharacterized PurR-regulated membrane protein YhhQ (DUF165 family)
LRAYDRGVGAKRVNDWLMPQHELPGLPKLSEARLYRRREGTFLVLAALFITATALMPLYGAHALFGASRAMRAIGVTPTTPLLLPLGALALPVGLMAAGVTRELYGGRRMRGLLLAALLVWLAALALVAVTDRLPDFDGHRTHALVSGLAIVGCNVVTCFVYVWLLGALGGAMQGRALWLRNAFAALLGAGAGWGVFALIAIALPAAQPPLLDGFTPIKQLQSIVVTAGGYTALAAIIGAIPMTIAAGALATYVRVIRVEAARRRPVLDDDPAFASQPSLSKSQPFNTGEHEFFDAGEDLASRSTASDSFSDLDRPRRR